MEGVRNGGQHRVEDLSWVALSKGCGTSKENNIHAHQQPIMSIQPHASPRKREHMVHEGIPSKGGSPSSPANVYSRCQPSTMHERNDAISIHATGVVPRERPRRCVSSHAWPERPCKADERNQGGKGAHGNGRRILLPRVYRGKKGKPTPLGSHGIVRCSRRASLRYPTPPKKQTGRRGFTSIAPSEQRFRDKGKAETTGRERLPAFTGDTMQHVLEWDPKAITALPGVQEQEGITESVDARRFGPRDQHCPKRACTLAVCDKGN